MTMPNERARALRFAGEFMVALLGREDVPADLKDQARRVLRHYPGSVDIQFQAQCDLARCTNDTSGLSGPWLAPEEESSLGI